VLGSRDPVAAGRLADDLGVAMQLTKILRHLVDDYERGRVYLPGEELARFGCSADLAQAPPHSLSALIRYQAHRNRAWYDRGLSLLPLLNRRGAACIATMTGTYTRSLDRIQSLAEPGIASTDPAAPSEPGAHRGDRAFVHSTNSAMALGRATLDGSGVKQNLDRRRARAVRGGVDGRHVHWTNSEAVTSWHRS
jgi:hypothetical protein